VSCFFVCVGHAVGGCVCFEVPSVCLWSTIVVFAFLPLSQRLLFELRPGSNGEPEAQEAGAGQSLRRQGGLDGIFQLVFICPIFFCIPISQSAFVCISMPQLLLQFRFSFWIHQTLSKLIRYFEFWFCAFCAIFRNCFRTHTQNIALCLLVNQPRRRNARKHSC